MGYPRDYKTLQRAVFVHGAAAHGAEASEFARQFPARPGGAEAGAGAAPSRAGVGDAVRSVFPDARETPSGSLRTSIGDRTLDMRVDHARNAVRLDFGWTAADRAGVEGNLQRGSLEVFRTIRRLADKLKQSGTNIEYTANDAHAGAYERMLRNAGYEQVSGPTGGRGSIETRTWRPAAERSAEWQAKYQELRSKGISDSAARGTADLLHPADRAAQGGLNEARDLLAKVDKGGVPTFVSRAMEKIAADLGVRVEGKDTPRDVVQKIRAASAAQGERPGSPSVERRSGQRPPQGVWDHIKAEHPDWNVEQIGREAARRADRLMVDPQTGLKSRSQFAEDANSGRHGQHVSIFDVPSMHEINNHFGDQAGDALLAAHGAAMREAGIEHGYRKGGDEPAPSSTRPRNKRLPASAITISFATRRLLGRMPMVES